MSLFLCSSGSNAQGKLRALEGRRVNSKALQGSLKETRDLVGGNGNGNDDLKQCLERKVVHQLGVVDLPNRRIIDFYTCLPPYCFFFTKSQLKNVSWWIYLVLLVSSVKTQPHFCIREASTD